MTAAAVSMNVTATESAAAGFVTVWPDGERPLTSTLNLERAGETIANHAIVPVAAGSNLRLFTQSGTHLLVDVNGWYTS